MKTLLQNKTINLLVMKKGDGYLGICKEFGFVEEGKTAESVEKRLVDSAVLLIDTVAKNPRLSPSLNVRPPFKYLCLFYIAPIVSAVSSVIKGSAGFSFPVSMC